MIQSGQLFYIFLWIDSKIHYSTHLKIFFAPA